MLLVVCSFFIVFSVITAFQQIQTVHTNLFKLYSLFYYQQLLTITTTTTTTTTTGLKSRQHQQQRQQPQQQRQQQRKTTSAPRNAPGLSTMGAGSYVNIWIPDCGWERDGSGHGDKLKAIIKRRLKNNKYEVIYPDKSLRVYDREQIIAVPKSDSNGGDSKGDDWNEANQALTHNHFFNRALSYNTLRSNDSIERERMIQKRRLQLKLDKKRKHAEGPVGHDDPIAHEQREIEFRTMPGNRFASLGLFPNTVR